MPVISPFLTHIDKNNILIYVDVGIKFLLLLNIEIQLKFLQ